MPILISISEMDSDVKCSTSQPANSEEQTTNPWDYINKTLLYMQDDKNCDWDRLCRLALFYYEERLLFDNDNTG